MCSDLLRMLAVLSLCAVSGCSIREDRTDCPGRLVVVMPVDERLRMLGQGCTEAQLRLTDDGGSVVAEGMFDLASLDEQYSFELTPGAYGVGVCCMADELCLGAEGVGIPEGEEFPPLYLSYRQCEVSGAAGETRDTVRLHKQWCTLTVEDVTMPTDSHVLQQVSVEAKVCGCGYDGSLMHGQYGFSVWMKRGEEGFPNCSMRIPRQESGEGMTLAVRSQSEGGAVVERYFPLGGMLDDAGYDWRAEDLEDVTVRLDFSASNVVLETDSWRRSLSFDIRI